MPLNSVLRASHNKLGSVASLYALADEHHLARTSRRQELAGGRILNPSPKAFSNYLPYVAARPVAALTAGARRAGFLAAASWGASLAVSATRTDFLLGWMYYFAFVRVPSALQNAGAPAHPEPAPLHFDIEPRLALPNQFGKFALAAPFVLAGWEAAFGTGLLPQNQPGEQGAAPPLDPYTQGRRFGLAGVAEAALLRAADRAAGQGRAKSELAWLAAAVGARLVLLPPRLAGALFVGSVAALGGALGIGYESGAQLAFFARLRVRQWRGQLVEVVPTQQAVDRQYGLRLDALRTMDDTQLCAPLIEMLWRADVDEDPRERNRWVDAVVAIASFQGNLTLPRSGNSLNNLDTTQEARAWERVEQAFFADAPPGQEAGAAAPAAGASVNPAAGAAQHAGAYRQSVYVHDTGRDPAMRRALATLLARYPHVDEGVAVAELRAELALQGRGNERLSLRRHESGMPLLAASKLALEPEEEEWARGFPAVLAPHNEVRLSCGQPVSLSRVSAVVWHAIGELEDPQGVHAGYRQERRDALLVALADCVNSHGSRVCGPGQAQRLLLVLQGFVEGVQIENYEQAPAPAQMEQFLYLQIVRDLPQKPTTAAVQARYDAAYKLGIAVLPAGQHAQLLAGLAGLADLDHGYVWLPRD